MTEKEFKKKFEEKKNLYSLWGNYLLEEIRTELKCIDFQVEPKVRVKDIVSLIAKAYYRNKDYENPYEDITDKVGIRFVVLLSSEIKKIDTVIQNKLNNCEFSKDRDFEEERLDEPLAFDYQSMHYILTSKSNFLYKDVMIPKGITCEVQVRTLLQHAYSELSHSRVYKPSFDPDAKVKRAVAKSMALLETTDDYFEEVNNKMNEISAFNSLNELTNLLKETMSQKIIVSHKSNYFIMDAFADEFNNSLFSLEDYSKLKNVVKSNFNKTFLNSQPIIFFIYCMILNKKTLLQDKWPLTTEELRPLFTQLGVSLNDLG